MELEIYDTNMNLIGIIDTATAVIWNRKYYSAGNFEIHAPANSIEISLIQKQYFVTKADSLEFGIIEDVTIEQRMDGEFIKAIGRFGSSLLGRRIVFDTTVLSGTYEVAMRTLVYNNAIDTSIGDRVLPNLILGTLNSFTEAVNFQVSYHNLLNVLKGLSITSGIATRIRFDSAARKFVFETYKALNRSVDQSSNPRAIFSNDYDNLLASLYQTSDVEYSNIALVGGEGDGADRKMVVVGSGAGLNRYEIFVNAKDIRVESGITEAVYNAMLAQKGAESLTPRVEYFEGNVLLEGTLNYKQDYDLGDIVTIENSKWGKRINVQITEITEVYDDNGMQIIPVFGTAFPSLGEVISKNTDTSGTGGGGTAVIVTPNKALISDPTGAVIASNVTAVELGFLSGVSSLIQDQLNAIWSKIYPIGSIFMSAVSTNPATLFGGTWVALIDRVLIGAGGTYAAGATGGATSVTLDATQIPAHTHIQNSHNHTQDAHNHTQNAHSHAHNAHTHLQDAHNHSQNAHNHIQDGHFHTSNINHSDGTLVTNSEYINIVLSGGTSRNRYHSNTLVPTNQASTATNIAITPTNQFAITTEGGAASTNIANTATNQPTTPTNNTSGGGLSHPNMMPYVSVYMWKRIA